MADEIFNDRRKALEEEFFTRENEKRKRALREQIEGTGRREALAAASGIRDERVLDQIVALGIDPGTVAALSLVPLVEVAWADGSIDAKEREAILAGAEKRGLEKDGPAYQLLEGWLTRRPQERLKTAWQDYVRALAPTLDPQAREALREEIVGRAKAVAEAAGGFLGLGNKVSKAEEAVLEEFARLLA